ncbi:MAG: alpha/beta hydrolase [Granulosicoccus sp.]
MPIDPVLEAYIALRKDEPRLCEMSPQEARASKADARMKVWPRSAAVSALEIEITMDWGRSKARLYRPSDAVLPLVIYYHGGGFMLCDIETHDGVCRSISGAAGVAVLSVDYRLAPEHPWPAGQEDATAAALWAHKAADTLAIDPTRIILAGDSAGGHLAAVAALQIADTAPVLGQALIYPTIDSSQVGHASYATFAEGFGLTTGDMAFFWAHYLSGASAPEAALLHREDPHKSPPTFIGTAEYDVLRDEGEAYAAHLIGAGVPVYARRYLGTNHNFLAFAGLIPACDDIYTNLSSWIRSLTGET